MDIQSLSTAVASQTKMEPAQQAPLAKDNKALQSSVVSPAPKAQQETGEASQNQVDSLNSRLEQLGLGLAFAVDEKTQSSVIKVVDKTTDEVVKQYPSEDSLRMIKNIQEYLNSAENGNRPAAENLTGTLLSEII